MEAIGRLAGGVAHDFNNLLTAIKGYGELLLESLQDEDQQRADTVEILKAADRAASLTRQLLAFSRRQVMVPRVLALDQVVTEIQNMLRRLVGEDIELAFVCAPGLGHIRGDAGQIEQILVNLVVNARDAMPKGGTIRLELNNVELTNEERPGLAGGRYVQVAVSDTGCGMDTETVAHIFEPFFTTKPDGQGTGLGLATVYGIVQQNGGTIEVDTQPGRGTTFRVYLPHVTAVAAPHAAPKSRREPTRGSETVLVAEDDGLVGALIANALRKVGYMVLEAANGMRALEIVHAHPGPIHLLLTDVVMPAMSGHMLSEQVASLRSETRVLFMSGYPDDLVLRHGVHASNNHFIQKPFAIEALAAKIRGVLGKDPASSSLQSASS